MARIAVLAIAIACVFAGSASAKTVWLCKPGMANDPCTPSLKTTVFSPAGKKLRVVTPKRPKAPKIDCFYVYPTVSDQPGLNANLNIDPVERSIALYQAARYSQYCRVFAPMYRQGTIGGIGGSQIGTAFAIAYPDVLAAWKDYLAHFNKGRGVVLIGHSQGTFHLRKLIAEQVDRKPSVRKRLISAILLGGDVTVRKGRDVGGDFKHVPACRSDRQLGCVIAFSTYDQVPPPNSLFGRTSIAGRQVLCTNPASLHGGSGPIDPIEPTQPFAPGSILLGIQLLELPLPAASTPFIEIPGAFSAHCSSAAGANVLQISAHGSVPNPKPSPDATWGEHLVDANIALGNLLKIVGSESAAYLARR
jgi:hypothetical protein